jgi:hypothetical protein
MTSQTDLRKGYLQSPEAVVMLRIVCLLALAFFVSAACAQNPIPPVVYEGTTAIQIADDFEHGRASTHYFLREQHSQRLFELKLSADQARLMRPGQQLRIRGRLNGKVLAADLDDSAVVVISAPTAFAAPLTSRRVISLLVDITDGSGVTHTVGSTCDGPDQLLSDHMFGSRSGRLNVDGCFRDGSYGSLGFGGSSYPGNAIDVVRVAITEPSPSLTGICNKFEWASAADAAAVASGVNLSAYQHRMYVLPEDAGCSWAGSAFLGCGDSCQAWVRSYASRGIECGFPDAMAHELGHNLGLHHARTDLNNDGYYDCEYCDTSDVMGYATNFWRAFNAPHKDWMGWLPPSRIVNTSASGTFIISALEMTNPSYPQVIKVIPASGLPYWLSYRAAIGYDASLANTTTHLDKLQVHRANWSASYLISELGDGGSFFDESLNLTVRRIGHSADSVTVMVWLGEPPPATAVSLTPSVTSPAAAGNTITFTAAASGGNGAYEYQFYLRAPGGAQELKRSYSTSASWSWNTSGLTPGTYEIAVLARNVGSTMSYEAYRTLAFVLAKPASAVTLSPSVASPGTIGNPILFSAAASGGSGKYEYQYYMRTPGGAQVLVRSYSTTASWSWSTVGLTAGTYEVAVLARNVGSTKSYEAYRTLNYMLATPTSAVTLSPSVASPGTIGNTISFSAAASGGSGKYEYQYYLRAPGGAQVLMRSYSTTASWSWNTTGLTAGTYEVAVLARNAGSTKSYEAYRTLTYALATPVSVVILNSSVTSPWTVGTTISFTAEASGGSGKYEYQYYLTAPGGAQVLVRSYSSLANWSWNTSGLAAGTYRVAVLARNVGSTKSYEAYRVISFGLTAP